MFAASKTAAAAAGTPPPANTDPQFPYVSLLLNDTGTNGQQNNTFLDSSSNNFTITRNGTPTQGSVTPYWPDGQWSNYLAGTPDVVYPSSMPTLGIGTGAFTMECWIYSLCPTASTYNMPFEFYDGTNYVGFRFCDSGFGYGLQAELGPSGFSTIYYGPGSFSSPTWTKALAYGKWFHLALVRDSGGTASFYVNGTLVQARTGQGTINVGTPTRFGMGAQYNGSTWVNPYIGYVSNARIVAGTALYTANFTPPTTPLTAVSGTVFLSAQSNRFKDNSSLNTALTTVGTPTVQAFEPFNPSSSYAAGTYGGSGYFNGTSDFLTVPNSTAFDQSGDFTIESWIYLTAAPASGTTVGGAIYSQESPTTKLLKLSVYNNLKVAVTQAGVGQVFTSTQTLSLNTWYHLALVKNGSGTNNIKLYINGVNDGSGTKTDPGASTTTSYIGREAYTGTGTIYFPGYMSNWRFVKGTAVYTANFTPPTSPIAAISGTSLLLNFTNAGIYDAAVQNDLVTVGDAQVSTTIAKWGSSSMKFDGAGDYLDIANASWMNLTSGDFTIEGWFYATAFKSGVDTVILAKDAQNGVTYPQWAIEVNSSGNLFGDVGTGASGTGEQKVTGTTVLSLNTWYHFAFTKSGTTLRLFLNGNLEASATQTITMTAGTYPLRIGGQNNTTAKDFAGYLEDIRITKGYARYTANFTPPTAAFPTR